MSAIHTARCLILTWDSRFSHQGQIEIMLSSEDMLLAGIVSLTCGKKTTEMFGFFNIIFYLCVLLVHIKINACLTSHCL